MVVAGHGYCCSGEEELMKSGAIMLRRRLQQGLSNRGSSRSASSTCMNSIISGAQSTRLPCAP